jgi:hypothetical protein
VSFDFRFLGFPPSLNLGILNKVGIPDIEGQRIRGAGGGGRRGSFEFWLNLEFKPKGIHREEFGGKWFLMNRQTFCVSWEKMK